MPASRSTVLQLPRNARATRRRACRRASAPPRSSPASPDSCCRGCAADWCAAAAARRRRAASACRSKYATSCSRNARRSCGVADRVDLAASMPARPSALPQPREHDDLLGVDVRAREAQRLDVELVELRDSGPSADARGGTSGRCPHALRPVVESGCARAPRARCRAVASGRSVSDSPFSLSSNVYISFSTMSVTSPMPRTKSAVVSTIGMRMLR